MSEVYIDGHRFDRDLEHFSFPTITILDESELGKLIHFLRLRSATFADCNLSDIGLRYLCDVPTPENLNLQGTEISNVGISSLKHLPNLLYFRIKDNAQLNNDCIPHLLQLRNIIDLAIQETSIDQSGLRQLAALTSLRDICLNVWNENYMRDGLLEISSLMPNCTILAKGIGEFYAGHFEGDWPTS